MVIPNNLEGKWLTLDYSNHSLEKLQERCKGSLMVKPTNVKLTCDNVVALWKVNGYYRLKVKINYSKQEDMILILQTNGVVRTVFYENKRKFKKRINK